MKTAIVVNRFPVLSESFIVRLVESLMDAGVVVCVVALEGVDTTLLNRLSPRLHSAWKQGTFELRHSGDFKAAPLALTLCRAKAALRAVARHPYRFCKALAGGMGLRTFVGAATFARFSTASDWNVVHAQFLTLGVPAVLGSRIAGIDVPVIAYARGYDVTRDGALTAAELSLLSAGGLAAVTCVSQSLADKVVSKGFELPRVSVIHAGIPISRFECVLPSRRSTSPLRFVQVGRMIDKKGYDLSLRMMAALDGLACTLEIVGDGPLKESLTRLAAELDLNDRVTFHGPKAHAETLEIVARANVMLAPSRTGRDGDSEGIPNVIKEAMAVGTICIGSTHSGIPELLEDGVTGYLFEEGNIAAFSETVRRAIDTMPVWDRLAGSAREKVVREFDARNVASALKSYYAQVVAQQSH